ncbi:hypothetical protein Fot_04526 [Forsythia ovata]|uniref:Uncharacterized protein n=1 Tax=Forsythia ovata TaxID=205694 RepID=A0ABD1XDA6_9LAMI
MSSFHFFKVPKFKIRCGEIVEDASLLSLASPTVSGSRPTVLQELETVGGNPHILPVPEARADIPSPSNPARSVPSPGNIRQSAKRKSNKMRIYQHWGPPRQAGSVSCRKVTSSGCPCGYVSPQILDFFLWEGGRHRGSDGVDKVGRNVHLPQSRFKL